MEHVNHVESVSHSIALGLGLDCELTSAIAIGHDLGHAPFGHHGETVLSSLMEKMTDEYRKEHFGKDPKKLFWHEQNGLRFVDKIELLPDPSGVKNKSHRQFYVGGIFTFNSSTTFHHPYLRHPRTLWQSHTVHSRC